MKIDLKDKIRLCNELLWSPGWAVVFELLRGDRHIDWDYCSKLTILKTLILLICPPFLVVFPRIIKRRIYLLINKRG